MFCGGRPFSINRDIKYRGTDDWVSCAAFLVSLYLCAVFVRVTFCIRLILPWPLMVSTAGGNKFYSERSFDRVLPSFLFIAFICHILNIESSTAKTEFKTTSSLNKETRNVATTCESVLLGQRHHN